MRCNKCPCRVDNVSELTVEYADAAVQHVEADMATDRKGASHAESFPLLSLLSGWAQQGVKTVFATQQAMVDVGLHQVRGAIKAVETGLSKQAHCPAAILADLITETAQNVISMQRILLTLAQQENELVMNGLRERMGDSMPAGAMLDIVRRSVTAMVDMQRVFLHIASEQAGKWRDSMRTGEYGGSSMMEAARLAMGEVVHTYERLLKVLSEEAEIAAGGRRAGRRAKKPELSGMVREAMDAFIGAQKKLLDLAGQQMSVGMQAASRGLGAVSPARFISFAELARDGAREFVEAEKSILDAMITPSESAPSGAGARRTAPKAASKRRRPERKTVMARAAQAVA